MSGTTLVLVVDGMSCEACVRSVTKALGRVPGVRTVDVDLAAREVRVVHDGVGLDALKTAIDAAGYDFVAVR